MFFPRLPPRFDVALVDASSKRMEFRLEAARALGRAEGTENRALARDALRPLLADEVAQIRAAAIEALGEVGDETSLAPLERCVDDASPLLRQAALIALARIDGERARNALLRFVSDERPDVRFQAIEALGTLVERSAADAIAIRTADDDAFVREAAVAALSELDAERFRERIASRLEDEDAGVRREAALALARISDERAAPELRVLLRGPHLAPELFDAVVAAGSPSCAPELRSIASRRFDSRNATFAAAALTALSDESYAPLLRRRLRSFFLGPRLEVLALVAKYKLVALAADVAALVHAPRGLPDDVLAHVLERLDSNAAARDALALIDQRTA